MLERLGLDGSTDAVVLAAALLAGVLAVALLLRAAARTGAHAADALGRLGRRAATLLERTTARGAVAALVGTAAASAAAVTSAPAALAAPAPGADERPALLPTAVGPGSARTPAPEVHVVRRGESLWSIARDHLGPQATDAQVARAWPRWWAANRRVVGPDPSLIVPGQHLRVPGRRSAGTPTQQHAAPAPTTGTPVPTALSLDPDRR